MSSHQADNRHLLGIKIGIFPKNSELVYALDPQMASLYLIILT
jgi:hypothetical protein